MHRNLAYGIWIPWSFFCLCSLWHWIWLWLYRYSCIIILDFVSSNSNILALPSSLAAIVSIVQFNSYINGMSCNILYNLHAGRKLYVVCQVSSCIRDSYFIWSRLIRFKKNVTMYIHHNNWVRLFFFPQPGDKVMVVPSATDDQINEAFPEGLDVVDMPSKKCYVRTTTNYAK